MASAPNPTPPRLTNSARPPTPPRGPQLVIKAGTNTGKVRDHNEDFFLTPELARIPPEVRQRRGELVIVADGMGGHAAGEVASRMTAEGILNGYYSSQADPRTALLEAIQKANAEIFHAQQRNAAQEGMGSTLAAALFLPGRVLWASVGDSRIYRLRGGRIEQLTVDHTWVHDKLRSKEITPEEANTHPYRSVITRAMGAAPSVDQDMREEELKLGDVYLLCSDGLSNMVTEEDLRQALASEAPQPAIVKLINLANTRGGPDNITAAVASYGAAEGATVVGPTTHARPVLIGAVGGVAVLAILLLIYLFTRQIPPTMEPTPNASGATAPVVANGSITATETAAAVVAPTSTLASTPATATPAPATATSRPAIATPTRTPIRATAPPAPALAAPKLEAPDDGSTEAQGSVMFRWAAVAGASGYRVETSLDQTTWKAWPSVAASELRLFYDAESAYFNTPGTEYFWRVAAVDGQGQPGAYSDVRRFVFNRPVPTPTPEEEKQPDTPTPLP